MIAHCVNALASVMGLPFTIVGIGTALPTTRVYNKELADELGVTPAWIETRCGVRARCVAGNQSTAQLGTAAATAALAKADGVVPDLLICATFTPERLLCPTAPKIAANLGLSGIAAFDLNAACSGGVVGLLTALSFLCSGMAASVLLVTVDTITRFLDKGDCDTRILFGDGAAAILLRMGNRHASHVVAFVMGSDGNGADLFGIPDIPGVDSSCRSRDGRLTVKMRGREMFRFAVNQGVDMLHRLSVLSGVAFEDVSFVISHQANLRIIRSMQEKTGIPGDRWIVNLHETGNTASASVLLALAHYLERREPTPGERGIICGFGAGLTWAGILIEW